MKETKSNWAVVADLLKTHREIILGEEGSHLYYQNPHQMLLFLSCYKFAAKLIGKEKRVLDLGCKEGLGTWVLAKECGFARGIDADISKAKDNFSHSSIEFGKEDGVWDALVHFDFSNPLENEQWDSFKNQMNDTALLIVGSPQDASLKKRLDDHFEYSFLFGASDEITLTGDPTLTQYLIGVGCKKR